jgi:hypothetical protein
MSEGMPRLPLWARVGNVPFLAVIKAYQYTLSPLVGRQCRFSPTCSWYGLEAYRRYGPIRGTWLTARRIARCNPFVKGGYDPVPVDTNNGYGR